MIEKIEEYFGGRISKTEQGKPRLVLFAYSLLLTTRRMSTQLSSITFFNGVQPFTAEEHLQNRDNILLKDGDQFVALNRITFLKGLMTRVHTIPVFQEETNETVEQTVCTTCYTTDLDSEKNKMTFVYDPSVFTNYSIFEFTETEIFPHPNGMDYRLGDIRCYTPQSWGKPLKMLFIGCTPTHCHRQWQYQSDAESDEENEDTCLVIPPILIPAEAEKEQKHEDFKEFVDTPVFRSLAYENLDWPETY